MRFPTSSKIAADDILILLFFVVVFLFLLMLFFFFFFFLFFFVVFFFFFSIRLTFHVNAFHMKCQPDCLQKLGKKSKCRLLQFCSAQKRLEIAQQRSFKLKELR